MGYGMKNSLLIEKFIRDGESCEDEDISLYSAIENLRSEYSEVIKFREHNKELITACVNQSIIDEVVKYQSIIHGEIDCGVGFKLNLNTFDFCITNNPLYASSYVSKIDDVSIIVFIIEEISLLLFRKTTAFE